MDLPSVLGGAVQGFKDFGTGLVDFFGTGGASILDLIDTIQTGKATSQRQDDYRKWLYSTDDNKDAAAKGLGTILNGVQTVSDYIPGLNIVSQNPLFNAGQGAVGGIADELKTYGKDYDLGRAGQRALVSGGAALASGALGDTLKNSSTPILRSNTIKGAARGALGGAINQGGYTAIEGGNLSDILSSAGQGATMGGVIGGATGMMQDFKPAKTVADGLTDDERQARLVNVEKQLDEIGPISLLDASEEAAAKRARRSELRDLKSAYEQGYDNLAQYREAMDEMRAAKRARRDERAKTATTGEQQAQAYMMNHRPTESGSFGYDITAGGENAILPADAYNDLRRYTSYTAPEYLDETANQLNAVRNNPKGEVTIYRATPGDTINEGDWITLSRAYADEHNRSQLGGKGNILEQRVPASDIQFAGDDLMEWGYFPQKSTTNDPEVMAAIDAIVAPENQEMVTLYRGMSAPDAPTLKKYLDDMRNPDIEPRQYAGASLFGRGYNATESLKEATSYAKSSDNGPAMGVFSIKLPKDSFVQMTEDAGNRERDFIIRAHDKYGGYHPEIDPKFNPEAMAQGKKDFMDYLIKNNIAGSVSDGGTYTIMNPQMTSEFKVKKLLPEAENYLKQNGYKSLEDIKNDPQVMEAVDALIADATPQPNAKVGKNPSLEAQDWAADMLQIADKNTVLPNELRDIINPSTLPQDDIELRKIITSNDSPKVKQQKIIDLEFGGDIKNASTQDLIDYFYGNDTKSKQAYERKMAKNGKTYDSPSVRENAEKSVIDKIKGLSNDSVDQGFTATADTLLSERLGIGPSTTYKYNNPNEKGFDVRGRAHGRYMPNKKDISVREYLPGSNTKLDAESALSATGHERLHSFQREADWGRYDKEVSEAYKQLHEDLKPYIKDMKQTRQLYPKKTEYYQRPIEQEARMFQQYLVDNGYTGDTRYQLRKDGAYVKEYSDKINPAFDKFISKLQKLSKKGVALPAIAALLGGGAYLTTTADEKDKETR